MEEFRSFKKIPRLQRDIVITEKLDGTNAQIYITESGEFLVGSRSRWITPEDDNMGFAEWAYKHKDELMQLGVGRHFGEWWGLKINRGYGVHQRVYSLFNTHRWCPVGATPKTYPTEDPRVTKTQLIAPACCSVVPVLYEGHFSTGVVLETIKNLERTGSIAAPGFMRPEGIVVYHTAADAYFKQTIENDAIAKGRALGNKG